jgi:xanthine dehydrogenase accessory factor
VIRYGISDDLAWSVGLACGGTLDVLVQPSVPAAVLDAVRGTGPGSTGGQGTTVVTELPADTPAPATARPSAGSIGPTDIDEARAAAPAAGRSRTVELPDRPLFIEAFPATPRLVIVGATEVARSLVTLAKPLGYERIVIDARTAFATPDRFPDVERLITDWPDEAFDAIDLGPNDAVAILSHDPKFDEPAIQEAIRRGARYVGAIGSKKTQADRRARLREAGVTEEQLAHLHGPIGLDLGGREPAETALAIVAEIVAARRGGSAAPMIDRVIDRAAPMADAATSR